MATIYGRLVAGNLKRRWLVIVIALASFWASTRFIPYIGGEFITEADRAELSVSVELPRNPPGKDPRSHQEKLIRSFHKSQK